MRDPRLKSVFYDFPALDYAAATRAIARLIADENDCGAEFVRRFTVYVPLWEYGYFFISQFLHTARLHRSYATIASLFIEGHSALRTSFLVATDGYQTDAAALLRKTHESFVRACACKAQPSKVWTIVLSSDIQKAERALGLDLKRVYRLESGFAHSNRLRALKTGKALQDGTDVPREFGPGFDEAMHKFNARLSIFWLYFGIKAIPALFPGQAHTSWIGQQDDSAMLMRGYLKDAKSALLADCDQVDAMVVRLLKVSAGSTGKASQRRRTPRQ
jgi:hypothetical protein